MGIVLCGNINGKQGRRNVTDKNILKVLEVSYPT